MRRQVGRVAAAILFSLLAYPSFGQNTNRASLSPQAGQPIPAYMAEFKTVNVQTLANGTTITTEIKETRARDSQGRVLFVTTRTPPAAGVEVTAGNIENPVEDTRITWDSHNKKSSVIRLPPRDQRHGCWTTESHHFTIHYGGDTSLRTASTAGTGATIVSERAAEALHREQTREDLGMATIQGLEARGRRITTVIPAGKVGNDSPITTTREVWHVPGFPFALREAFDDPRSGKTTRETVSLTIGEPDLVMFQPPEGYEAVNVEMVPCQQ